MSFIEPRALVIEDDLSWQQILSEILADSGLAVDLAEDLRGALEIISASPHRLAILDLSLEGSNHHNQDGLHVLDAVRQQDPGCIPILLTGYATVELAVSAIQEHGAFTCLRKETFKRAAFRELVDQALVLPPSFDSSQNQGSPHTSFIQHKALPMASLAHKPKNSGLAIIVEDNAGWRSLIAELLADVGYDVDQSSSYGEALGKLKRDRYQLAVVDLSLVSSLRPEPNLDGYRLLASTRKANIPTIVVSGFADLERIDRAYAEHNIFACFEKQDFDRLAFLDTVKRAGAAPPVEPALAGLTERELEVLELIALGLTNKEIAKALYITQNTVKRHLKSLFHKLGVHTRAAASAKAIQRGMDVEAVDH